MSAKPVILTVDDDPEVLSAIERDLRQRYRDGYRIVAASSGPQALEAARELQRRGTAVALFLADQRMPGMTGTQFLQDARKLHPAAKRALLTAYADSDAAIAAINEVGLDHYLMKPWDPPDQRLYPVLDDLLGDWSAHARPSFEGVRVIGSRWSPQSYATRDFLSRNQIPYRWIDIEQDAPARELVQSAIGDGQVRLPVVILADGTLLTQPTPSELAAKTGLQTAPARPYYDLAIVGAGPAGLACAVYGASEGLKVLARRAATQAKRFGTEILVGQSVTGLRLVDPYKVVQLSNGAEIACHALMLSAGMSVRELDVPGVQELQGKGVYYGAALSEAAMYRGQRVYVLGGANSAGQGALFFARYAAHVTMIVRKPALLPAMSRYLADRIACTPNISVLGETEIVAVHGNGHLDRMDVRNARTGEASSVDAGALFIFIGVAPRTEAFRPHVATDEKGFILTGADVRVAGRPWGLDRDPLAFETSVPGIFAAGDVRANANRRIAAAVGEGSAAIFSIHQYLRDV